MKELPLYDLEREGDIVRAQMNESNPVDEARNLVSQAILAQVVLALSDARFHEFLAGRTSFDLEEAIQSLSFDRFTFSAVLEYLVGRGAFVVEGGTVRLTRAGQRLFNVYTRGVLNVYLGAYRKIFENLAPALSGTIALADPELARSTRHAAQGTAFSTCSFVLPKVFSVIEQIGGKVCLDLGCGTGDFLLQLARSRPTARGVGVDMSVPALDQARARASAFGVGDRLTFHEARVGVEPLPVAPEVLDAVDTVSSMYMLHEFGRSGRGAIVDVVRSLAKQLPGRSLVVLEVVACEPEEIARQDPPPPHFGRLDYRLIHQLSLQGLPRSQPDWHGIFEEAGCTILERGIPAGGSLIYVARL